MKTLKKQTLQNTEAKLTLFQGDSLANHTVTLGSEKAKMMTVTSGLKCYELFERYNHVSSWAKTLLGCLVGTTEWYSTKLLLTWKMKDMKHKRFLFQLVPRTPHTEGIEFGLLPTPDASIRGARQNQNGHQVTLQDVVSMKTKESKTIALKFGILPTPTTRDYKGARSTEALSQSGRTEKNSLPDAFHQNGKTSQLNPLFVAEMMGFPPNWTVLPFQNGETNQSKATEMP